MQIVKFGDRGPSVLQLQQLLNGWPTRLLRLKCDGIFGKHTQTRVLEFQRDKSLAADGHVGPATMGALLKLPPSNHQYLLLLEMISTLSAAAPPVSRPKFENDCRTLVAPLRAGNVPIVAASARSSIVGFALPWQLLYGTNPYGLAFMALMILLTFIIAIMLSSKNPRTRERGLRWQREAEQMESTAGEKAPEVAMNEALQKTKQAARELVESKAEALERCKGNNPNPSPPCQKALQEIERLKREIFEKLSKPQNSFPGLVAGITRNIGELMAAYREAGIHCRQCDDLIP